MGDAEDESDELRRNLAATDSKYREVLGQNRYLERDLWAAEEELAGLRRKLRSANCKRKEADHYRSILHRLRSRWYLRPFIPKRMLLPPGRETDPWKFRGPRFAASARSDGCPRRRVLVVGHLLGSMLFGSETSLLDIIFAIDPDRFDIFVVFPERNEQVFAALRSQVQGIAVFDYFWWRLDRPPLEETVAAFAAILRRQAIDLVHVNTIMIRDPLVAARRLGLPSITNAREIISQDEELAFRLAGTPAQIVREVCANANYLLANSAATLAGYPCGNRGGFLFNSIDEQLFDLPNSVDPQCINVGMISSNIRKKGVLEFFELARTAEEQLPVLQFHLIGPESSLTREWREGGQKLPANFHLRGHVVDPPDAYRDLNVVLNLSRFAESFGRTVAEALTARRPVVGYHHGALPELIDDGETGFLVPYLDLAAVLDRLRFFAENPAKIEQFGESARARSLERFSREKFAHDINALYERLIAEGRPAR